MGKATTLHADNLRRAASMRLGLEGYIRILASLRHKGMTAEQVSAEFDLNHNTTTKLLRYMHRLKLVHRESWFQPKRHSRHLPVWRLGADGDVSMPQYEGKAHRPPNPMLILLATSIECLQEHPLTVVELAGELAMHKETAARIVQLMRLHGLSHIRSWTRVSNGLPVAQHGYLGTRDAARPPRPQITPEDRRRWRNTLEDKRRHMQLIAATAGATA